MIVFIFKRMTRRKVHLPPFESVVAGLGDEEFAADVGATAVVDAGEYPDQAFVHEA